MYLRCSKRSFIEPILLSKKWLYILCLLLSSFVMVLLSIPGRSIGLLKDPTGTPRSGCRPRALLMAGTLWVRNSHISATSGWDSTPFKCTTSEYWKRDLNCPSMLTAVTTVVLKMISALKSLVFTKAEDTCLTDRPNYDNQQQLDFNKATLIDIHQVCNKHLTKLMTTN